MVNPRQFEVFLISLDPTVGAETKKTRPCVIVSPDEMNQHIQTVIVAPLTSKGTRYPTRVAVTFRGTKGQIVLDQIRTVDKSRLIKKLGAVSGTTGMAICNTLVEMFSR